MKIYKLYYNRMQDLLYILLFGLLVIGIIMISIKGTSAPPLNILIGVIFLSILTFFLLNRYIKNEYMESVAIGENKIVISYSNNNKKSYTFDEIKFIGMASIRGVKHIGIGLKKGAGFNIRPYYSEAEELYNELSSHHGLKDIP